MPYKPIMIVGSRSHVGKTTIVSALCRLYANQGINVTPFKSQNMSLNGFVTQDGLEIARSTAIQASAAKIEPVVHMNPILLKPESDLRSQVIMHGKVVSQNDNSDCYFQSDYFKQQKEIVINESIDFLKSNYDLMIVEGAGGCAEPNFQKNDWVNLGLAKRLNADVYIVVDINQGGAFSDILGILRVLELLSPQYLNYIKGFILNQFRGDKALLQPAIDFIKEQTSIPIVGIMPYLPTIQLDDEDALSCQTCENPEIDIAVIYLPHIANVSDFTPLQLEKNVRVRFVRLPEQLGAPDVVILPGTKNTLWDLNYIRQIGWENALHQIRETTMLLGICGGFEMMGMQLFDPKQIESDYYALKGFGFFDMTTTFAKEKQVRQVNYSPSSFNPYQQAKFIKGYEIHSGVVNYGLTVKPLYYSGDKKDGMISDDQRCLGTFIHDVFKNSMFTREFVNRLRLQKGLLPLKIPLINIEDTHNQQYDQLASTLVKHCPVFQSARSLSVSSLSLK